MLSKKPRMSASTIQFTPFRSIPTLNASSALCGLRPRPESVTETPEIFLIYCVEDRHHRLLYDFVFQRCKATVQAYARTSGLAQRCKATVQAYARTSGLAQRCKATVQAYARTSGL